MWAALKLNHANTTRSRVEITIIAVALALIGILLTTLTVLAREQVYKAQVRDSLRQSQRLAMARCWQESPSPSAMRGCMAEVRLRTARALDESYGLAARQAPAAAVADVSMVSYKY